MRRAADTLRISDLIAIALLLGILAAGCGEDETKPKPSPYKERTSEANVLYNFQVAYRERDCAGYAALLAEDFLFHFDGVTRITKNLPEFWERSQDSTATCKLFQSPLVTDIRIYLQIPLPPKPVTDIGHERWTEIDVQNVLLEIDLAPQPGEGIVTVRVEGQIQRFFFRKGRTEADTLATSPTAKLYYLVAWWDQDMPRRLPGPGSLRSAEAHVGLSGLPSSERMLGDMTTWGSVKSMFIVH